MKFILFLIIITSIAFGVGYFVSNYTVKVHNINKGRHYEHPAVKHL